MLDMKRRDFITLLGGATAWPLVAKAQQREGVRRIGVLMSTAVDDPQDPARLAAFAQGLQELSWIIGRNVRIDYRWSASSPDNARKYAAELAALAPDVILASGSTAMLRRAVPHRALLEPRPLRHSAHQIRPARSIFSAALNFCCSSSKWQPIAQLDHSCRRWVVLPDHPFGR